MARATTSASTQSDPATVEERLMLLMAGTRDARQRAAASVAELLDAVDFEELHRVLVAQRLMPLVGTRIVSAGGERVPADFRGLVESAVAAERHRGVFMAHITRSLVEGLAGSGIRAVTFKGCATAERVHGDLGLRGSSDIDLLVERPALGPALSVMEEAGYELPPGRPRVPIPALHYGLVDVRARRPPVDLHWRVHWYERDYAGAMVARSLDDRETGRVLAPLDELVMLLLCLARDGFAGLRYLADIAAWWDEFGDSVEDGALDRLVDDHPGLERALVAAVNVAEALVDAPLRSLLDAARRPDPRTRMAMRLVNWAERGDPDQVLADQRLVDWLLSPNGGSAAFARRFVFTGRSSVVRYDHLPESSRPPQAVWRITHPAKVLSRFLPALWRVRTRRAWAPRVP